MKPQLRYLVVFGAGCILTVLLIYLVPEWSAVIRQSRGVWLRHPSTRPVSAQPEGETNLVANAAAKVAPAVVTVHTSRAVRLPPNAYLEDPLLRRFLGKPGGPKPPREEGVLRGTGSGVVLTPDGYILTNQHVVDRADRVTVRVGETGYDARVVGSDELSDIAVLKINAKPNSLTAAQFGDSDAVHVGDWAIAVGNPLDIGITVTLGIISAVHRRVNSEGHPLEAVLQTDAAINPGNSGGALANIQGQVIGINEAIVSPTGSYAGIGFAAPINAARKIAAELIAKGKIVRPYLGISYVPLQAIPPEARREVGIMREGGQGVVVTQVTPGSPAAQAGLQVSDVIVEANHQKITDADSLNQLVRQLPVGSRLPLLVSRHGQQRLLTATLQERPAHVAGPGAPQEERPKP